jgi:hypothetical protein
MLKFSQWLQIGILSAGMWATADVKADGDPDACKAMQKADVETAFAPRKFDAGSPGPVIKGSAKLASVSSCTYSAAGATVRDMVSVTLMVRRAPTDATGTTPAQARQGAAQLKTTPFDVSDLGDGAYWVNIGSAATPSIQLNVFRGKREWLIFSSFGGKMDSNAALANLTKVAKMTLAR